MDAYGRTALTEKTDTPSDDLVSYSYDADGRLRESSSPYRTGDTPVYTQTSYDGIGRTVSILDNDGVSHATYTYLGNTLTIADEASKKRKIVRDAAGRTSQVFEPDSSNNLTLETDYQYDQNQTTGSGPETYQTIITQRGGSSSSPDWRVRTFTNDISGRVVSETTPESGTVTYTYPNTSPFCAANLSLPCNRTDANGTVITYAYDALSRLTGKTYSGSIIASNTPSVSYSYDQTSYNGLTIANGKGLLTGVSDGSGETAWSYDGAGNVKAVRKTINNVTKEADYTYNADFTLNTLEDFGGTTFTYAYNAAGLPTGLTDGSGNSYAASAVYNAAEELTSVSHKLTSSGPPYVRSWQYNTRMQPSVISATLNGSTVQSLQYGYGSSGTNNGNILSVVNGMDPTRSETFSYDNLNRLASGHDGSHFGEQYTYDNWGNLYQTARMSGYTNGNNWSVSASDKNQLSNLQYDSGGEVTQDQFGNTYSYDAEGRLLSAGGGTYVYDGAGNRVKKTASSVMTLYWPGAGSSLLDESNSAGTTMAKQVTFAGLLIWSESVASGGRFLFQDHLGSTRITGTAAGNLKDDLDFLPFGSVGANYGAAPSDEHYTFTGYESDQSESSTDYAVYRNLATTMGRFNRPDPYDGSYDQNNPKSLNRYTYVLNNPLAYRDPSGLLVQIGGCIYSQIYSAPAVLRDSEGNIFGYGPTSAVGIGAQLFCVSPPGVSVSPAGGGGKNLGGGSGAPSNPINIRKTVTQQCLGQYNSSPAGKAVQFLSLFNLATNFKSAWLDWTVLPAAKMAALKGGSMGSQAIGGTEILSVTGGATTTLTAPTAGFIEAGEAVGAAIAGPAIVGATGIDIAAHAYCDAAGRTSAGQMSPVSPAGYISF